MSSKYTHILEGVKPETLKTLGFGLVGVFFANMPFFWRWVITGREYPDELYYASSLLLLASVFRAWRKELEKTERQKQDEQITRFMESHWERKKVNHINMQNHKH